MNKHAMKIGRDAGRLADDARAMVAATADVAGAKIGEIRERLGAALKHDKKIYDCVRGQAAAGARLADRTMHSYSYLAAAIGIGCGALIGFLVARQIGSNR